MKILEEILQNRQDREALIRDFQVLIWNDENSSEILSSLAYDLDFYEPDEKKRNEDPSYFGDDRLEEEIKAALAKLKNKKSGI